jgi:hypothetical protein
MTGSRRIPILAGWLAVLLLAPILAHADDPIQVTTLTRDGQILVSFDAPAGFTDALREAISSGLPTLFAYDVEVVRAAPFWFDRTVASADVTASVRFDSLTGEYDVMRIIDGRTETSHVLADEEAVRLLLTRFERIPLFTTGSLEANGEYHVRVRSRTRPRTVWFLWPWEGAEASGVSRFTFLP